MTDAERLALAAKLRGWVRETTGLESDYWHGYRAGLLDAAIEVERSLADQPIYLTAANQSAPLATCRRCTGEYCDTHGADRCDCDTADRHAKEPCPNVEEAVDLAAGVPETELRRLGVRK